MKIIRAVFVAAALAAAAPAQADDVLDLSTITCKDFIASSKDRIGLILMWLQGYYTAEDDPPVVDFDKLKTSAEGLGKFCSENPSLGLMTAAEEVMSK